MMASLAFVMQFLALDLAASYITGRRIFLDLERTYRLIEVSSSHSSQNSSAFQSPIGTPLSTSGPPEKPVQGNACGSTKGTLVEDDVQKQRTNDIQSTQSDVNKASLWTAFNNSMGRMSQKLHYPQQTDDNEDILIYEKINRYIPDNEIGLGCMRLETPSPVEDSTTTKALNQQTLQGKTTRGSGLMDDDVPMGEASQ